MTRVHDLAENVLPPLNASLNGLAATLIVLGWLAIRRGRVELHRGLMVAAMSASALFLVSYVVRMALTGTHRFEGPPLLRSAYLVVLGSHMILAVAVVPLVTRVAYLGLKRRDAAHRRLARFTLPIWLYVSITGVVIYVMLYHLSG